MFPVVCGTTPILEDICCPSVDRLFGLGCCPSVGPTYLGYHTLPLHPTFVNGVLYAQPIDSACFSQES